MLTEIKARLTLPTPAFWKKIQRRSAAASAAFAGLTVTVATFSSMPPVLATSLGYLAAGFGFVAAVCSLAVDDPTQLPPPESAVEPSNQPPL